MLHVGRGRGWGGLIVRAEGEVWRKLEERARRRYDSASVGFITGLAEQ